ncbi:MAG TPA: SRPBCC family protein [Solirubrobacteraceae bacterium]
MKELHGQAGRFLSASTEECFALVADVESYPRWHPEVVRSVVVVESARDGTAERAETSLHVSYGPLARDFELTMAIDVAPPGSVSLVRIAHGPSDREEFAVRWQIEDRGQTWLGVELSANLAVPRLVPLGGIGEAIAAGFLRAAADALDDAS